MSNLVAIETCWNVAITRGIAVLRIYIHGQRCVAVLLTVVVPIVTSIPVSVSIIFSHLLSGCLVRSLAQFNKIKEEMRICPADAER